MFWWCSKEINMQPNTIQRQMFHHRVADISCQLSSLIDCAVQSPPRMHGEAVGSGSASGRCCCNVTLICPARTSRSQTMTDCWYQSMTRRTAANRRRAMSDRPTKKSLTAAFVRADAAPSTRIAAAAAAAGNCDFRWFSRRRCRRTGDRHGVMTWRSHSFASRDQISPPQRNGRTRTMDIRHAATPACVQGAGENLSATISVE